MKFNGKSALITGASRGVGRATAQKLANEGCAVLINYCHSKAEAQDLRRRIVDEGGKAEIFRADVSEEKACREMVEAAVGHFGRLDILVNNAGTTDFLPFNDLDKVTDDHWDRLFGVNVKGAFYCARAAQPHLESSEEGGRVVNVTSVAGIIGAGSSIAYCASKAALINTTQSLARALAPKIAVNSVAPGFIADDWTQRGLGDRYESVKQSHQEKAALQRVCQPEDVADAIVSLVGGSAMVTGQTLICDGGVVLAR